ncbi:polar amino acid ABC transporter substrate-binding protein, partial [Clavibacter michiganensis subsp. insidiosus]
MTLRSRLRPSLALTGLLAVAALGLAGCASGDAGSGSAPG